MKTANTNLTAPSSMSQGRTSATPNKPFGWGLGGKPPQGFTAQNSVQPGSPASLKAAPLATPPTTPGPSPQNVTPAPAPAPMAPQADGLTAPKQPAQQPLHQQLGSRPPLTGKDMPSQNFNPTSKTSASLYYKLGAAKALQELDWNTMQPKQRPQQQTMPHQVTGGATNQARQLRSMGVLPK